MSNCDHFDGQTRDGKRLRHTDQAEQQIQLGLRLQPWELLSAIRESSFSACLVEEAIVFLLLHYRGTGDPLLVEALAATLDQRMRARAMECWGILSGVHSSRELCGDVASLAWIILLESPTGRGVWLQLCFRRFIHNLVRDVLRGMRAGDAVSCGLDSGDAPAVLDHGASPEELVYAQEVLSRLTPYQRQAFIMQRGFQEPQRVIAKTLGRSERSVRTWLKQAERELNAER